MTQESNKWGRDKAPAFVSAREVALKCLIAVDEQDAYADVTLRHLFRRYCLSELDRALATELAYGAIRRRNTLDWLASQFSHYNLTELPPAIRNILRLGIYQLYFLDNIPPWAAINEAVNLAKKFGHRGVSSLVNAVLRRAAANKTKISYEQIQDHPAEYISIVYSHPQWLVERWIKHYGQEQTIALARSNNEPPKLFLRVNVNKTTPTELITRLNRRGWQAYPGPHLPEAIWVANPGDLTRLPEFSEGLFFIQDEGSMMVSRALAPEKGQLILDACAGPGSKTTHLAELIEDTGTIIALDINEGRLKLVRQNCQRLGLRCIGLQVGDARQAANIFACEFDSILVDAPCSGTGVLRRRPDARWKKTPALISELSRLQEEILAGVSPLLKPGGTLVYSTCSLEPEENNLVVKSFLERHPQFKLDSLAFPFEFQRREDRESADQGFIQLFPHIHGTDGFFIARMKKKTR